jgi:hypothetical protein
MKEKMKIKIVQSLTGAIVLTILMAVFEALGFGRYIWMLFFPLLLFFALGADFKKIPSMIVCYICGVAWAFINGVVQGAVAGFAPQIIVNTVPTILIIFAVLVIHEGVLANTVFGNVPCLFLGMCTTFFVFMLEVDLTPIHLIGFYLYGTVLSVVLVLSGMGVCAAVFGKERAMKAIVGELEDGNEADTKS